MVKIGKYIWKHIRNHNSTKYWNWRDWSPTLSQDSRPQFQHVPAHFHHCK